MEVVEIQTQQQPCKFSRVSSNGRNETTSSKVVHGDDKEVKSSNLGGGNGGGGESNRLRGWHHHSSRIIRVSRASGGKDRHSKVWTSKGLRDRRVRLSVSTAIQFYDLQDRLGYDQPSKAVEWLIKAAADSIAELPTLNNPFPDTPKQLSDEKRCSDGGDQGFDSADIELEDGSFNPNQNQHISLSKSACSSTSETSKGSGGLSLSRSDIRVNRIKARERARERAAKEKENTINPIPESSTFTELLTGGISSVNNHNNNNAAAGSPESDASFFQKAASARQWPLTPMDYFNPGLIGTTRSSGFPRHIQLGNSVPQAMTMAMAMAIPPFNLCGDNHDHQEQQQQHMQQHFPFVSDHFIPVAATCTTAQQHQHHQQPDYNLNFTISSSSGLSGFNRGTLQSNSSTSPSLLPHLQRFSSSSIDGSTNIPFFFGGAAPPPTMDNHHQFQSGLQLCYGDGSRHSDHKGKGKH